MRRLLPFAVVAAMAFAVWSPSRGEEPTTERPDPKLLDIPGPFHAFNVTGTTYKGRYHSRIAEYGLEPMMMIYSRRSIFSDPLSAELKDLLPKIDAVVEANPTARLHPFLVVESKDLPDVVGADVKADSATDAKAVQAANAANDKADDLRLQLNALLTKDSGDLKLQHVDIDLAGKTDLEKFQLGDANFAFYVFQRGQVTASRVLGKDNEGKLTDADVKAIMELNVKPFGRENTLLLATRDADLSEPLTSLLQQIDAKVEKNPAAVLHPVLALLSDDAMRNEAVAKLEAKTKDLMLKHIEVVGAGASDLARYHVETAPFSYFLVQRGKTIAGRALGKDEKLTSDVAKEVLKTLAEKAGADK